MTTEKKPKQKKAVEQAPAPNKVQTLVNEFFSDHPLCKMTEALSTASSKIVETEGIEVISLTPTQQEHIWRLNECITFLSYLNENINGK